MALRVDCPAASRLLFGRDRGRTGKHFQTESGSRTTCKQFATVPASWYPAPDHPTRRAGGPGKPVRVRHCPATVCVRSLGASQVARPRQRRDPSIEGMQAMRSSSYHANGAAHADGRGDGASPPSGRPTTLLIGHGTRDAEGAQEALDFAARLADHLASRPGPSRPVVPCFLELTDPPILPTIAHCVEAGAREIVALPLMLFAANHVKSDIPAALAVARARHPDLTIRYGAPLGVQPEMLDVVDARIAAVEAAAPPFPREETAVLLVERGSSDPDANAQVYQLGRMLWEGRGFGWVEPCFIGITRPSLEEGLARCLTLGARRVLVLPYFLFTGVLVRRISRDRRRRRRTPPVDRLPGCRASRLPSAPAGPGCPADRRGRSRRGPDELRRVQVARAAGGVRPSGRPAPEVRRRPRPPRIRPRRSHS